ncbi:hypothetical protein [Micromonospora fluostatini]|uniref:hypothetical protein n=1 Tax=Micromonospora sp. JCM 30529 TaxID=3421643 RepID=UPI003D18506E
MSERMSSRDRPLVSHLLDVEALDPADLDAIPRELLRRSLRRLIAETGDPTTGFLWWQNTQDRAGAADAGRDAGRGGTA